MLNHIDWAAFLIAMAAVELTPGPNMGWLAALSAQQGRAAGMRAHELYIMGCHELC